MRRGLGLAGLVFGCLVLATLSTLRGSFSVAIGGFGAFAIGTFLAGRVPGNRVSLAMQVGGGSAVLADWSEAFAGPSGVGQVAAVVGLSVFPLIALGFNSLLLLFPTGRALPGWQWFLRAIVLIGVVAVVAGAVWALTLTPSERTAAVLSEADTGSPAESLSALLFVALPVSLIAAAVRYRRSTGVERLQMRWLLLGATFFFFVAVVQNIVLDFDSTASVVGTTVGLILYPLAVALAVQRYRLYDIDRIVSRTVSYGVVAVFLALVFGLLVVLPTALMGRSDGADPPAWLVALSTLIVFALFSPLRSRVQRWVERRFNRARYDAEAVVGRFAVQVRDQADLREVASGLGDVTARAVEPTFVGLWLRQESS